MMIEIWKVDECSSRILWYIFRKKKRKTSSDPAKKKMNKSKLELWKGEPQKGLRMLKTYRRPIVKRSLPYSLGKANRKFEIPSDLANRLASALATELLGLDVVSRGPRLSLENYRITDEMKDSISPGNIHKKIIKCETFLRLYGKLIEEHVAPLIAAAFEREKSPRERYEKDTEYTILYQYPPTVRIYCSHLPALRVCPKDSSSASSVLSQSKYRSLGRFHCDAMYGHQDGEVNFWMPLTRVHETNTLWAESEPGKSDWYSFSPMQVGEIWHFPGSTCRHYTKPNVSGWTRVSIDFRCSTVDCYDKTWTLPGMSNRLRRRHEMMELTIRIDSNNENTPPWY